MAYTGQVNKDYGVPMGYDSNGQLKPLTVTQYEWGQLGGGDAGFGFIPQYDFATTPSGSQSNPLYSPTTAVDSIPNGIGGYTGKQFRGEDGKLYGVDASGAYQPLYGAQGWLNGTYQGQGDAGQLQGPHLGGVVFLGNDPNRPGGAEPLLANNSNSLFWDKILPMSVLALTGVAGGGLAAGAGAGGGAATGAGAGTGAAGESLVGPATGTVLEPGLQASGAITAGAAGAGLPTTAGVAAGGGPLISTALGGTAAANAVSGLFDSSPNGGAAYLPTSGKSLAEILGQLGAAGLGYYGSTQQADTLRDIANQFRADRAPFLNKSLEYLNNPAAYFSGPVAQEAMRGTLRGLSVNGNPFDNPTSQELATEAGLRNYQAALGGLANLGLSGQDTQAGLLSNSAAARANGLNAIGYGLQQATNPQPTLMDIIKQLKGLGGASLA